MTDQSFAKSGSAAPASSPKQPPLAVRLGRLGVAVAVLLFLMHVAAPFLVKHIGPLGEYARVVNETGITPGALYYSDVPQTVDAEFNNRDAIRYFTNKKASQ